MFEHQRGLGCVALDGAEIGLVVDLAAAGDDFDEVDVHLRDEGEILGVAGDDPGAQLLEEIFGEGGVVIEERRAVDRVAHIDMDGEGGAVDGFNQLAVGGGGVGCAPAHDFEGESGAFGFDGVEDFADVFNGGFVEAGGEVVFVGAVPDLGVEGAGDIDAAAGADGFGEGEALLDVGEVGGAGGGVGVEHVFPGADFGDDDVGGGEGFFGAGGVGEGDVGAVGGGVAEALVLAGEFGGVGGLKEDGAAEAEGRGGGGEGGGGEGGEEVATSEGRVVHSAL